MILAIKEGTNIADIISASNPSGHSDLHISLLDYQDPTARKESATIDVQATTREQLEDVQATTREQL